MDKKITVILEKEEKIAEMNLNIARAKRRQAGLAAEKAEIELSIPQWEKEITKELADIQQIEGSK